MGAADVNGPIDTPSEQGRASATRQPHDDPDGLLALYGDCGAAVYTLALQVTSSPAAAAEITCDVFTQVLTRPHQANIATGTPRSRLAALTHTRAIRAARHLRSAPAAQSTGDTSPAVAGPDAQQLARSLAVAARMSGAAADLDAQQRLTLAVTYLAGRTIGDTARILGLSRSTVLAQLATGLRLLAPEDLLPGPEVVDAAAPRPARRAPVRTAIATLRTVFHSRKRATAPSSARHRHASRPPAPG